MYKRPRVAKEVADSLRAQILGGEYAPGGRLPPERELATALGVNRASLREAIKALELEGLVRSRQGDGTLVLNYMESGGVQLIQHLLAQAPNQPRLIKDMLELRQVVGRELARLAAQRATPAACATAAARAHANADALAADLDLYADLAAMTDNQVFVLFMNSLRQAITPYGPLLAPLVGGREGVRTHHEQLLAAVARHDAAEAAALADAHLGRAISAAPR